MRVITQNLSAVAADVDGFTIQTTDVGGPFPLNLALDGALSSVNAFNGVREVDLSANAMGTLVGFTTGLTGSTAVVTITGLDQYGHALTEAVTMPGASSTVASTNVFSKITSMSIDGAHTNLSVGILASSAQISKWAAFDHYQNPFKVNLQYTQVTAGATSDIEITNDTGIFKPANLTPDVYTADAPFAAATASVQGELLDTPAIAARVRMTTPGAGVVRVRYVQSGGGFR